MIEDVYFYNPFGAGPAIELNGCYWTHVRGCNFAGTGNASQPTVPAIRLNASATSTTPTGLPSATYNNTAASQVFIEGCTTIAPLSGTYGTYASLVGSDKVASAVTLGYFNITNCETAYASVSGPVNASTTANYWIDFTVQGNQWYESQLNSDPNVYNAHTTSQTNITKNYQMYSNIPGTIYRVKVRFNGTWGSASPHIYVNMNGTYIQLAKIDSGFSSSGHTISGWFEAEVLITTSTLCNIALSGSINDLTSDSSGYLEYQNSLSISSAALTNQTFSFNGNLAIAVAWESNSGSMVSSWSTLEIKYPYS